VLAVFPFPFLGEFFLGDDDFLEEDAGGLLSFGGVIFWGFGGAEVICGSSSLSVSNTTSFVVSEKTKWI